MKDFQELNVRITFYYPFRIVPWANKENRKHDEKYCRGGTFAKWHKIKDNIGKPYITGTLVRSTLYRELKKIISLVNPFECCMGIDETIEGLSKPDFLRLTPTMTNNKPCKKCILCLIMGRSDIKKRREKIQENNNKEHWLVHFSNFHEGTKQEFDFNNLVTERIVNRVDSASGKAKDYMKVWEIDPCICCVFNGKITINTKRVEEEQLEKIKLLLAAGLSHINVLAGSICRVDITQPDNHQILINKFCRLIKAQNTDNENQADEDYLSDIQYNLPKESEIDISLIAKDIAEAFSKQEKKQRLRRLADTIRELRHVTPQFIDLPKGTEKSIWERSVGSNNSLTIRKILEKQASYFKDKDTVLWRRFCENLGRELYKFVKELVKEPDSFRLLGETELYGLPSKKINDSYLKVETELKYHFIVCGNLIAKTPFYFGVENQSDQTSAGILLNRNDFFYLPRTVIRGALRRDLSFLPKTCNAKVGEYCDCDICKITRNIIVEDAVSSCNIPPEIRYRIRLNPHMGTVEEGALFDMETGYQGLKFPLRLHIYSSTQQIDDSIIKVLYSWQNDQAILGGDIGSGFGRFGLIDLNVFMLKLSDNKHLEYSMLHRGIKKVEDPEILNKASKETKIDKYKYSQIIKKRLKKWGANLDILNILPWERISYEIKIASPLISRDPIAALIDKRNVDTVMIKKRVLKPDDEENKPVSEYMIKGESMRGIFRSILIKSEPEDNESISICDMDHEDCYCMLCRLFGNIHHQGKLRFEDVQVKKQSESEDNKVIKISPEDKHADKKMDHVAIDRFTGGAVNQMKFDDYPIPGSPDNPLILEGSIWIKREISDEEKKIFKEILSAFSSGIINIGGLSAIGYGWISEMNLIQKPDWLKDFVKQEPKKVISNELPIKMDSININVDPDKIYHPHYFIKPKFGEVKRVKATGLISHTRKKSDLFSGTIKCTLTTKGPLFIPDTENENYFKINSDNQPDNEKHKNYGFFRINDKIAIPGSSIRGMISSVYEALTHSCFRIMDEKHYITRRVTPESEKTTSRKAGKNMTSEDKNEFLSGRVIKKGKKWYIKQMGEIVRLPIYDNLKLILSTNKDDYIEECSDYMQSLNKAIEYNKELAKAAEKNRQFLLSHKDAYNVLIGKKEIYYTLHKQEYIDKRGRVKEINPNAVYACLTEKIKGCYKGFIKFTGADMVTVSKEPKDNIPPFPSSFENKSSLYSFPLHNKMELRSSQKKKYPRPVIAYVKDGVEYRMQKRCERIFTTPDNDNNAIMIPEKIITQYNNILEDNRNNFKNIPMIFQTIEHNKELSEGDLVYFRKQDGKVLNIAPVSISRLVDDKPLGKRFPDKENSLRSCMHTCIENCEECPDLCEKMNEYISPHPKGLCPACHLFGTTFYKSRVNFGIAWLRKSKAEWYINTDDPKKGGPLTLPLLEKPRATWSMPNKQSTIPGRKFYIHHPASVDKLKQKQPASNKKDAISITPNNRTVEAVGKGNEFEFEIKFNNLKDFELGLLLYSIELETNLAHKLGMAKAFGMGSVQIKIEDINLTETPEINISKKDLIIRGFKELGIENIDADLDKFHNIKDLRNVLWFPPENIKLDVRYPGLEGKEENNKKIPGYVDFIKEKDPKTDKKNPDYLHPDDRKKILQSPWKYWYPVIKSKKNF